MSPFTCALLIFMASTRPDTTIQACHTTQKRCILKPALSSLSNAEGQNQWTGSVTVVIHCVLDQFCNIQSHLYFCIQEDIVTDHKPQTGCVVKYEMFFVLYLQLSICYVQSNAL